MSADSFRFWAWRPSSSDTCYSLTSPLAIGRNGGENLPPKKTPRASATRVSHTQTPGRTVRESGIGPGLNLPLYPPSVRLTGIDLSQEMLDKAVERAQKLAMPNTVLKVMDATSLDFSDSEFDK